MLFSHASHMKQFISPMGNTGKYISQYIPLVNNFAGAPVKRKVWNGRKLNIIPPITENTVPTVKMKSSIMGWENTKELYTANRRLSFQSKDILDCTVGGNF